MGVVKFKYLDMGRGQDMGAGKIEPRTRDNVLGEWKVRASMEMLLFLLVDAIVEAEFFATVEDNSSEWDDSLALQGSATGLVRTQGGV